MMGGTEIAPESVSQITYEFLPGEYIMLNWPIEGDGPPEIYIFTVEDGEAVTDIEPQEDMVINLIDFAFAIPAELEAGTWLWEVHNTGDQWHELVIAPIEEGTTLEEVTEMILEDIMGGQESGQEPQLIPIFIWSPMAAGSRAWFNITLEQGTYVVVCGLPDLNSDSGHTHLEEGMIQIVTVR
jgi:hypothetical protein